EEDGGDGGGRAALPPLRAIDATQFREAPPYPTVDAHGGSQVARGHSVDLSERWQCLKIRCHAARTGVQGCAMDAIATHYRTCSLCEATCGLEIRTRGREILGIRGDEADPF